MQHAYNVMEKNWIQYKFRFTIKEALLRARINHQMQQWQKTCNSFFKKKLIIKSEWNEIMMTSQKLGDNAKILDRNLKLFARMIKFENILHNMQIRM